ncbi:type I restriction endonuclease [Cobetia crustatorum]|uniref:type I restriction endonuclease n=1 Tax=Cobetia crustatorum TaxID=553385 RepID=UPI00046901FF|nr:type I restriction endonuclease [Cobetia crustatorum]
MSLIERFQPLVRRAREESSHITTEEATKTALVLPMLQILGYDVFNPREVIPEYIADIGKKKGEKVDYAIMKDGEISVLIECKPLGMNLDQAHFTQLYRYFSVTPARFGVLTNGVEYRFFSDLDDRNKLDDQPFFRFDLLDHNDRDLEELKKFSKSDFEVDNILGSASQLKYISLIQEEFSNLISDVPEDFVKFLVSRIYEGRMTQSIISEFKPTVYEAIQQFIREQVDTRLKKALNSNDLAVAESVKIEVVEEDLVPDDGIETTQEEIDAYNIVRAMVCDQVDIVRVVMRDTKSYCGILLDDNNRRPICRLHFNGKSVKRVEFFDDEAGKVEIKDVKDIFEYKHRLVAALKKYA